MGTSCDGAARSINNVYDGGGEGVKSGMDGGRERDLMTSY
jgi:hypothetical protein